MVFPEFPSDAWEYIKGPMKQRLVNRTSTRGIAATKIAKSVRGSIVRAKYWAIRAKQRFYQSFGVTNWSILEFMHRLDNGRMLEAMREVEYPRWGLP